MSLRRRCMRGIIFGTSGLANRLPGSFGAKTYVISSSLLDTSLRNLSSAMAEVVGIVAIIVGKTEGFA
jgi:hypothetical protein